MISLSHLHHQKTWDDDDWDMEHAESKENIIEPEDTEEMSRLSQIPILDKEEWCLSEAVDGLEELTKTVQICCFYLARRYADVVEVATRKIKDADASWCKFMFN